MKQRKTTPHPLEGSPPSTNTQQTTDYSKGYFTAEKYFLSIPISFIKNYKQSRGMSYWHDVKDWLGGYPMEFAGNKETEVFCRDKLKLELVITKLGKVILNFYLEKLVHRIIGIRLSKQLIP